MDGTARSLGLQVLAFQIREADEIESAFNTAMSNRANARLYPPLHFSTCIENVLFVLLRRIGYRR